MLPKVYSFDEQALIQKAICFLVWHFDNTGDNPKPVIMHSIRMAVYLYNQRYPVHVVSATVLHDILEDTQTTEDELSQTFGEEITKLVTANTFKNDIEDYVLQYTEMFGRIMDAGYDAAIIKATDLLDNADYYHLSRSATWKQLYGKLSTFVDTSKHLIGDSQVWQDLHDKRVEIKKTLHITGT